MDLQRLKEIIDWMARSPVVELEISDGDFKVHLIRDAGQSETAAPARQRTDVEGNAFREISAPSYGIVHLSPTPGSPPFVQAGHSVVAGQTVCIIEAMKVFSSVEAEQGATIAAVLVQDGAEVTAGQALFSLE